MAIARGFSFCIRRLKPTVKLCLDIQFDVLGSIGKKNIKSTEMTLEEQKFDNRTQREWLSCH